MLFCIWDWSLCGFCFLQGVLKPIPTEYWGTTVLPAHMAQWRSQNLSMNQICWFHELFFAQINSTKFNLVNTTDPMISSSTFRCHFSLYISFKTFHFCLLSYSKSHYVLAFVVTAPHFQVLP
jgi:hypothetical protein